MKQDNRFGRQKNVRFEKGMRLDTGQQIFPLDVSYETYGSLDATRSNAILICHALTGDQYVTSTHPLTGKPGWWSQMVGPGKAIDTNRYFIVCSNVLGSCMGTTGPSSLTQDGDHWAMRFPSITIRDMVRAQALLLDHLGIDHLFAAIGASMGGMQVLEWAMTYPDRMDRAIIIASSARQSAQNIALNEVGRQAIMADAKWNKGNYYTKTDVPSAGLAVARMAAHITYLSDSRMTEKFGRRRQKLTQTEEGEQELFEIESYLHHQAKRFVARFDANSYLCITRAIDYFDPAARYKGELWRAFQNNHGRFCVISFTSDGLYTSGESKHIVRAMNTAGAQVSFLNIKTNLGHDAFLLDVPEFADVVHGFLEARK